MGHWVAHREEGYPEHWANRPEDAPDESVFSTDRLKVEAFNQNFDLFLVSPRPATITTSAVRRKFTHHYNMSWI